MALTLPHTLRDGVARGEVALFLGAGASRGARLPDGKRMPMGGDLRDLIADRFLGGKGKDRSLEEVANYAANQAGRAALDSFVAEQVRPFGPSAGHLLLPAFRWQTLFTINYDLLVERAYEAVQGDQKIIPFTRDQNNMDRELKAELSALPFFKLHGSIDRLHDPSAPLILTTDTYVGWENNRKRIFNRLTEASIEYPVVHIGTSLTDHHIKVIRAAVGFQAADRPMHYFVSPGINEFEEALFTGERMTPIRATFDEFMIALNENVSENSRKLYAALPAQEHSIQRHFRKNTSVPPSIRAFLTDNVDHVRPGIQSVAVSPEEFFRGQSRSWTPIESSYDIKRKLYEIVMLKTIAFDKGESGVDIIAVQGVAGSGKSVFAKRLAWDLGTTYRHLVLFAGAGALIRAEPIVDLFELTGQRPILVIDNAADSLAAVNDLIARMEAAQAPLTIIMLDTHAALSGGLDQFGDNLKFRFELRNLTEEEIELLLAKLEEYQCLGMLEPQSPQERLDVFLRLADKQLLVALYEATQGKLLEDILVDEYHRILLTEAQELYLIVCTLHQFRVGVRAGLVRRLTGVNFEQFRGRLLGPLTGIVSADYDTGPRDYVYRARHSHIAGIVFNNILSTHSQRVNQFLRILDAIDPSYSSDNAALRELINWRNVRDLSPNIEDGRRILATALNAAGEEPFILQQMALLEMNSSTGNLKSAREYLDRAQDIAPWDRTLKHSRANLLGREANAANDGLIAKSLRGDAKKLLRELRSDRADPYVSSLNAQLAIDELREILPSRTAEPAPEKEALVLRLITDAEQALSEGLSRSPEFQNLILQSSRLRALLGEGDKAERFLANALARQAHLEFVAIAYAKAIRNRDLPTAISAVRTALQHKSTSKPLNQMLFDLMMQEADDHRDELSGSLRRSFTDGDGNTVMHVHAVRYHFLRGDRAAFEHARTTASNMQVARKDKDRPRLPFMNRDTKDGRFVGDITSLGEAYGFVTVPSLLDRMYLRPIASCDADVWETLRQGSKVSFVMTFNARGAIASEVRRLD